MSLDIIEVLPSEAHKIISLYNDNIDTIENAEEQLNLQPTIIGETKPEESTRFDIDLADTVHYAAMVGKKMVGYIMAQHFMQAYEYIFPTKREKNNSDYPQAYNSLYISNITTSMTKDSDGNLLYDAKVLRHLLREVVDSARNVDGIVVNLPESLPVYVFEIFKAEGFEGIGVNPKFFNRSTDSYFLEYKLKNKKVAA